MNHTLRARLRDACTGILPLSPHYAAMPIETAFDWSPLAAVPFERLYLVVFRSVRRADADADLLRRYDDRAYREAVRAGGLLLYFRGVPDERRACVSFCLWETREQAIAAAGGTRHEEAAGISARTYEVYDLERYDLLRGPEGLLFRPALPLAPVV